MHFYCCAVWRMHRTCIETFCTVFKVTLIQAAMRLSERTSERFTIPGLEEFTEMHYFFMNYAFVRSDCIAPILVYRSITVISRYGVEALGGRRCWINSPPTLTHPTCIAWTSSCRISRNSPKHSNVPEGRQCSPSRLALCGEVEENNVDRDLIWSRPGL